MFALAAVDVVGENVRAACTLDIFKRVPSLPELTKTHFASLLVNTMTWEENTQLKAGRESSRHVTLPQQGKQMRLWIDSGGTWLKQGARQAECEVAVKESKVLSNCVSCEQGCRCSLRRSV